MLNGKIKAIIIVSLIIYLFLINTLYTDADLFAERNVQHNRFSFTTLNFSLRQTGNGGVLGSLFRTVGFQAGGFDVGAVRVKKEGKLDFKYHIKIVRTNGDDALCNALNIQVLQRNMSQKYQGKLMSMAFDSNIGNNVEDWIFFISLDEDDTKLQNKICEFDIDFKTWRNSSDEKGGIFAERKLNNVISTGTWQ
ncbi:MAG: hypothetical protein Q7R95_07900 [bacterium]|nr:hypothetical protein [bacterium]